MLHLHCNVNVFEPFPVGLPANLHSQPIQSAFLELLLSEPFLQIQNLRRTVQDSGVDLIWIKGNNVLIKLADIEGTFLGLTKRKQLYLHSFSGQLLGSFDSRKPILVSAGMWTVLSSEQKHSEIVLQGIYFADRVAILPKYIIERHSRWSNTSEASIEFLEQLSGLFDAQCVDGVLEAMHAVDVVLVKPVVGVFLHSE